MPVTFVVAATVLGGPKKEVMLAFALGFFASEVGSSVALRLSDMMIRLGGRLKRYMRDSLAVCSLLVGIGLNWYGEEVEMEVGD